MNLSLFFVGTIIVLILYIWNLYNNLVTAKVRVEESWSGIDIQLKRRTDLIPNLIEAVKGYAKHEREVFKEVTEARSALLKAQTPQKAALANNQLTSALKSLFAVAENYPQLQASENFLDLQKQLTDTEDKIAYARQFYNTNVLDFNVKIRVFPSLVLASWMGFKRVEFFKTEEEEKKAIKVKF